MGVLPVGQAAGRYGGAHDDLHAGTGAVQRGGQRVCLPAQRERLQRRGPGVPPAEPDDRRGRRHCRGHQRPALPLSGREEAGDGGPGCRRGYLPAAHLQLSCSLPSSACSSPRPFFVAQAKAVPEIVDYGVQYYTGICLGLSVGIFSQFCFERLLQSTGRTSSGHAAPSCWAPSSTSSWTPF